MLYYGVNKTSRALRIKKIVTNAQQGLKRKRQQRTHFHLNIYIRWSHKCHFHSKNLLWTSVYRIYSGLHFRSLSRNEQSIWSGKAYPTPYTFENEITRTRIRVLHTREAGVECQRISLVLSGFPCSAKHMEEKVAIFSAVSAISEIFMENALLSFERELQDSSDEDILVSGSLEHSRSKRSRIEESLEDDTIARVKGYVENVVPLYSDDDFKCHFRLSRTTVKHLIQMIPSEHAKTKPRGMTKEKSVLLCLWLLGNNESFHGVSDRFSVSQGVAHRAFIDFCMTLTELSRDIICWPRGEEVKKTVSDFNELHGSHSFPGVIGCIDDIHIPCTAKKDDNVTHYNSTSIILQAVCNSKMKFTDVFVDWPDSLDDGSFFERSSLYMKLHSNPQMIPDNCHLLGDNAYPLSKFLLTPYHNNGHLTDINKYYNQVFNSTKVVIEQAFAHLIGRFRKLNRLHMFRKDLLPEVIVAACVLHNLCIICNDAAPEVISTQDNRLFGNFQNAEELAADGIAKRSRIARTLYNQKQHQ